MLLKSNPLCLPCPTHVICLWNQLFFFFFSSVPQWCLVSEVGWLDNEIIPNKTGIIACKPPCLGIAGEPGGGLTGLGWLISAIRAQLAWPDMLVEGCFFYQKDHWPGLRFRPTAHGAGGSSVFWVYGCVSGGLLSKSNEVRNWNYVCPLSILKHFVKRFFPFSFRPFFS